MMVHPYAHLPYFFGYYFFSYKIFFCFVFLLPKQSQNLDLSDKTDLDLGDCLRRVKLDL